jgi:hypothetical protein
VTSIRRSPLELLELVAVIARHANPDDPQSVSQRAWDAARAVSDERAPRAHAISQRLGVPWRTVLRVALGNPDDAWRQLTSHQADKGRKGITLDAVIVAMRQAALRLGDSHLDRGQYRAAREQIMAASRGARRGRASHAEDAMPTLNQLDFVLRQHDLDWAQALERAELASHSTTRKRRALSAEEAVRAFVEDFGAVPRGSKQMRAWSQRIRLSIGTPGSPAIKDAVAAVQAERATAGKPPWPVAGARLHLTATKREDEADPRAPAPRRNWDRAALIRGMARAVRLLAPGQQLDERTLKRLAEDHPHVGIPSYSSLNRHLRVHPEESFAAWCREAERLARGSADL